MFFSFKIFKDPPYLMEQMCTFVAAFGLILSFLYSRVYSYPCLGVYLDQYEVSINLVCFVQSSFRKMQSNNRFCLKAFKATAFIVQLFIEEAFVFLMIYMLLI